jgi:tetratricopeptide (TPR) repeat protein
MGRNSRETGWKRDLTTDKSSAALDRFGMQSSILEWRTIALALVLSIATQGYVDGPCLFADEPTKQQGSDDELAAKKIVEETTKTIDASRERDWEAFENRADAWMTLGEFGKAFDDYSKAISLKRDEGRAHDFVIQRRIDAAIANEDYQHALSDAQTLVETTNPPNARYYADLAIILSKSPDAKVMNAARALEAAEIARNIRKGGAIEFIAVELALAAAHSVNGNFDKAASHQETAIEAMTARGLAVSKEAKLELEAYKNGKTFPFSAKREKVKPLTE